MMPTQNTSTTLVCIRETNLILLGKKTITFVKNVSLMLISNDLSFLKNI